MPFEDDEDAVDVNVLCICDRQSGTAPTLLLGLGLPKRRTRPLPTVTVLPPSLSFSPSSPFVRLSKFSMFIQFTLPAGVGEGETAAE